MSRTHREVFFAHNGSGPYVCHFCEGSVDFLGVYIHHRDENKKNNEPANLVACHRTCHASWHMTDAWKRGRNRAPSPEQRQRQSEAMKKRIKTPEHLELMRQGVRRVAARKKHCVECDKDIPGNHWTIHVNKTGHTLV